MSYLKDLRSVFVQYDRVDPAEMQALKEEVERLKKELATATATASVDDEKTKQVCSALS